MKPIAFLTLSFLLLVAGCSKGLESEVVGKWKGPGNGDMELKQDKTFTLGAAPQNLEGKWSVEGDKTVKLDVEKIGGKPKKEAIDQLAAMFGGSVSKDKLDEQKKKAMDELAKMSLTYDKDKKTPYPHRRGWSRWTKRHLHQGFLSPAASFASCRPTSRAPCLQARLCDRRSRARWQTANRVCQLRERAIPRAIPMCKAKTTVAGQSPSGVRI